MEAASNAKSLQAADLEVRPEEFVALARGRPLPLTVRELQLLAAFAARAGRVVSREELHEVVWKQPFNREDRSVDVYVRKLRVKLARELPEWSFIHTHFGFGYRFAPERKVSEDAHANGRARDRRHG